MLRSGYERALGRPVSFWEALKISLEFFPIFSIGRHCLLLLGVTVIALAQDCRIPVNLTIASNVISPSATTAPFNNKAVACVNWQVNLFVSGISALSIQFESASDLGGNTPGTFAVFAGTLLSGSNPSTTTTQSTATFTGMFPWLRMNATSATGTGNVIGVVYGFRATSSSINPAFGVTGLPLFGVALSSLSPPGGLSWTWFNQSTATVTPVGPYLQYVKTTDAATQFSGQTIPVTAGSFTCVIGIVPHSSFASFVSSGIFITDGTKAETYRIREDGATEDIVTWSNASTVVATPSSTTLFGRSPNIARIVFLKIHEGGGTRSWEFSADGSHFNSQFTEATNTFLTATGCGPMFLNNTGGACNPDTTAPCHVQTTMLVHATATNP